MPATYVYRINGQYVTSTFSTLEIPIYNNSVWQTTTTNSNYITLQSYTATPIYYTGNAWRSSAWPDAGWAPQNSAEIKKIQAKRQKAIKKANLLLKQNLSKQQWHDYNELGYFEVISQKGNVYRIYEGRSRNVRLIRQGKEVTTLCAHPQLQVPNGDTLLAQKLWLECAEDEFVRTANVDSYSIREQLLAAA